MRRLHLIPILTLVPFVFGAIAVSQLDIALDSITVAIISIGYILVNILYSLYKKTFQVHLVVEFALVALIAYFVLTWSI